MDRQNLSTPFGPHIKLTSVKDSDYEEESEQHEACPYSNAIDSRIMNHFWLMELVASRFISKLGRTH